MDINNNGSRMKLYGKCFNHTPGRGHIIKLKSIPSRGTLLPTPLGKGDKCDLKKLKGNDELSLRYKE